VLNFDEIMKFEVLVMHHVWYVAYCIITIHYSRVCTLYYTGHCICEHILC